MGIGTNRVYNQIISDKTVVAKYKFRFFEKICIFISFMLIVLVAGLQMSNSDYEAYKYLYTYEYSHGFNLFQVEFLFRAINKIVYDYLHEFQFVVLITTTITNLFMFNNIIYYSLHSKVKPKYVLFLYLCMYFLVSFGMLRQICAASIVIYSIRYIYTKKYIKWLICTFLALSIHATAFINFIFLLFAAINIKSKTIKNIYRFIVVIIFYLFAIFSNKILITIGGELGRSGYSNYYAVESLGLGNIVYRLPILAFLFVFRKVIEKSPPYVKLFAVFTLLEALVCFTYYFIPMLGGRLQYYILFGYAILIPYCMDNITRRNYQLPISNFFIYGFGLYYLFNQLLTTEWITKFLMPIKFFKF